MVTFITHIRTNDSGTRHEHITHVKFREPVDGKTECSVAQMVQWIESRKVNARVTDGQRTVDVLVVNANPKHIRTVADAKWTDNLLALPRF